MNSHTSARLPLRLSETVDVLVAVIEGRIRRDGQGQFYLVEEEEEELMASEIEELRRDLETVRKPVEFMLYQDEISDLFTFSIREVHDEYAWGAYMVPRAGLLIKLKYEATGEIKEFYQAGQNLTFQPFIDHMKSLTDDLCLSWFVKREKKPKKEKKVET